MLRRVEFGVFSLMCVCPQGGEQNLEPSFHLALEGANAKLQITVPDKTKSVAGVSSRVVEEWEWKSSQLHERNHRLVKDGFFKK